eukprot:3588847-Rhodomonas_salina.1
MPVRDIKGNDEGQYRNGALIQATLAPTFVDEYINDIDATMCSWEATGYTMGGEAVEDCKTAIDIWRKRQTQWETKTNTLEEDDDEEAYENK